MGQNEELFHRSMGYLNAQDGQAFKALLAPDVEYINPQGVYRGRDAAAASFEPEWRAFPDGTHEVLRVVETPTGVVAEIRWSGTHEGTLDTPMGPVPPTGRRVELTYSLWVDLEAGLAKSSRVYFDTMGYAAQLGLIPQPQTA